MVFGVIITNIEDLNLYYARFYGEQANDTKKHLRLKQLIAKVKENCTQQKEIYKEKQKLSTFIMGSSIISSRLKTSLASNFIFYKY